MSLSIPIVGEEEKAALREVIDSGWLSMGTKVQEFESAFAALHSQKNAVALSSCTAALHAILRAFDIGPGDEVLVPAVTFVATANAVLYVGATPVFIDIEDCQQPLLSLDDAAAKCSPKTKAVIVMHYGGYAVDVLQWRNFCDRQGIRLIEDAAHAPGVSGIGRLSDASAFSFFANKNMSTAEGGMVLSPDEKTLSAIRRLRGHGMTSDTIVRHLGHAYSYDVTMLGFNYRLDELRAAVGLVQLQHLPMWNRKRNKLAQAYRQKLAARVPSIIVPFDEGHKTSAHLMPLLLPENCRRKGVMDTLRRSGIQSSIHYPPVHLFSHYRKLFPDIALPKSEEFCRRELSLPLHPALEEIDVDRVTNCLQKALEVESGR
ncbi:MAG: DegT/DnrJ/EryC1/StrS aminotransferase family protein [Candidatus Aminicenantes bacterium]|nr:MAG: DegT/DnrJ/EryC1/StrS aminotransferase family protein [Candidatus Aminicenantes bacterium]